MKGFPNIAILISLLGVFACASRPSGSPVASSKSAPFRLRAHEYEVLGNGLNLLWVEDDALPYVSLQMMVKSGSAQDPTGREGLASVTADMLEKGSTERSGPRIAADFEQMGSEFKSEVTADYTVVSTSALTNSRDQILAQFREVVLSPKFSATELERHLKNQRSALIRLPDDPAQFIQHALPKFLYGPTHAYGHEPEGTLAGLRVITRADVIKFYARHYVPSNAVLAVVGQFDEAWRTSVRRAFSSWAGAEPGAERPGQFPVWRGIESAIVTKPDLKQAQVMIATKGVARDTADYMEVRAALKILGESFGSRLFEEIRVNRGLTYFVQAVFDPRETPGPIGIVTSTRLEKLNELITETLKVYRSFVAGGVTDAEVDRVRAQMKSQFIGMFETPESLARQLLILNRYGINESYLTDHLTNVDKLTAPAINQSIRRHFSPDDLRIMVMAPANAADATLKSLGPIDVQGFERY